MTKEERDFKKAKLIEYKDLLTSKKEELKREKLLAMYEVIVAELCLIFASHITKDLALRLIQYACGVAATGIAINKSWKIMDLVSNINTLDSKAADLNNDLKLDDIQSESKYLRKAKTRYE